MATDGPARATRGPTPVNRFRTPPSLCQFPTREHQVKLEEQLKGLDCGVDKLTSTLGQAFAICLFDQTSEDPSDSESIVQFRPLKKSAIAFPQHPTPSYLPQFACVSLPRRGGK